MELFSVSIVAIKQEGTLTNIEGKSWAVWCASKELAKKEGIAKGKEMYPGYRVTACVQEIPQAMLTNQHYVLTPEDLS